MIIDLLDPATYSVTLDNLAYVYIGAVATVMWLGKFIINI